MGKPNPVRVPARLILAALVSSVVGCEHGQEGQDDCPPPEPAFQVKISAGDADIPRASRITVTYGAGKETHSVNEAIEGPAVFCEWVSVGRTDVTADGGDATEFPSELHCDLWTSGPALLEFLAPGFMPVGVELRPDQGDCGIVTRQFEVALERPATVGT